ncbi:MAG: cation:proton antiporter [Tannerella sp.]|nr:cation:proton antiporter [Tannerella sp.]
MLMILFFGSFMFFLVQKGSLQHTSYQPLTSLTETNGISQSFQIFGSITMEHIRSTIGILLLQIIVILAICRCIGVIFKKIGQPTVIGEIMAGIILGPSVLGYFFPSAYDFMFPVESLSTIGIISQFGLILFMYTVGMDLDFGVVRKRLEDTIIISHTSTIAPFVLGMLVAYFIYDGYAYENTPFVTFALFIGISLSVTAFPVLARIIQERGLTRTHLGSISLASAANGDITSWCILAAVVAFAHAGSIVSTVYTVLFSIIYICIMWFVVRPILRIIGDLYHNKEVVDKPLVALMFFLLIVSSYLTEILGLHALFGAFIAGIIMPDNLKFRNIMNEKVEDVSLALFLPLFFVYTGLRTEIGLIQGWSMWLLCGVFVAVAVIGKFGGTLIAARISRESWKDSLNMGALMNTRGLMELVVLTIGLEMRIIPATLYVMLVLMTLVTTFMTTPLMALINVCFRASEHVKRQVIERLKTDTFKVLLSFGRASSGQVMLDLAHQMFSHSDKRLELTALHLTVGSDVNPLHTQDFESVSFKPILFEADKLNMLIQTKYDVCSNAEHHICSIVNNEGYNFLLVGSGVAMSDIATDVNAMNTWQRIVHVLSGKNTQKFIFYPGSLLKDKTKEFVSRSACSMGVFVNRGFIRAERILMVCNSASDLVLLSYVSNLQRATHGFVQILDRVSPTADDSETVAAAIANYIKNAVETALPFEKNLTPNLLKNADLMIVSYDTWLILTKECNDSLQDMPSTLIINHIEQ